MTEPVTAPFSEDSEKAFLSSLIQYVEVIERCNTLTTAIFFVPAHQILFRMLVGLREEEQPIEFVICKAWLKKHELLDEVGGPEYLNDLWTFVPTGSNWEYYLNILKEHHVRRRTIQGCQSLMQRMYDQEYAAVESIRENVEHTLTEIVTEIRPKTKEWSDVVTLALEYLEKPINAGLQGVQFNIQSIDLELSGIRRGEYAVICAEVSVGKTAIAMQAALNSALCGNTVAIFSFEMSAIRMALRMFSQLGKVRMHTMRNKLFSDREHSSLLKTAKVLKTLPIKMEDAFNQNINGLVSRCRQIHAKEPLELVVVDYLQLVTPCVKKNDNREREVADISRKLKNLAGELDIVVIALSQLNEFGKMRESRSISQDADIIIRLSPEEGDDENARNVTIDKNRDGPRGKTFPVTFEGQYVTFTDAPVESETNGKKNGSRHHFKGQDA